MKCQETICSKILYLFILLSYTFNMNSQPLKKTVSINEGDSVILYYNGDNGSNLIKDMHKTYLTGDTLKRIEKLLSNTLSAPKLKGGFQHIPKMYLSISRSDGSVNWFSIDKQTIRIMDYFSQFMQWELYYIKKKERLFVKSLLQKVQTDYNPIYKSYSDLPLCSRVRPHPSMFAGSKCLLVTFFVLTSPNKLTIMNYYVYKKKRGIEVYRNVYSNFTYKYTETQANSVIINSFINREYPSFLKQSEKTFKIICDVFPSWKDMTDKERMDMLDGFAITSKRRS